MTKKSILSYNLVELKDLLSSMGIEGFRAVQIYNWIYQNGIIKFDQMNNLPDHLIDRLKDEFMIGNMRLENKIMAEDGTKKYLWKTIDENFVESVFLPYNNKNRYSICVSSQIGCSLGCKFCATGLNGLTRNLKVEEIIEQILMTQIDISEDEFKKPPVTNIVFMGMGEPFLNYKNVMKAIEILNNDKGLNIGQRKITVSTSGVVDKIKQLAKDNNQIGLAISLNAPNDQLRDKLMPINKKHSLNELFNAIDYYIDITNRRVTFEYVMIKGINDKKHHVKQLINLMKNRLTHLNLIPYNQVKVFNFKEADFSKVKYFKEQLEKNKIPVSIRIEKGTKIKAACGQLRSDYKNGG
ncbi:MAG: 23S rRNA (adenine(2503)-C(2))-methyltransferase RlmN [Halanaerobiales bacterium]|nr:23S rRNA (adenine(2503)-C(2))-methyltransferase RlmN [Halanaerobiales bacterium]